MNTVVPPRLHPPQAHNCQGLARRSGGLLGPFYHTVRPAHLLLDCWHGGVDCLLSCSSATFVIWLTGEYHIHAVLARELLPCIWWWGTWGWGWWWGTNISSFSFG